MTVTSATSSGQALAFEHHDNRLHLPVPPGVKAEGPWSVLAVRGPLDLNTTGVLAGLATPLAAAGVSIFAVSTYDTDYVLVRNYDLDRAVRVLRDAGHHIPQRE